MLTASSSIAMIFLMNSLSYVIRISFAIHSFAFILMTRTESSANMMTYLLAKPIYTLIGSVDNTVSVSFTVCQILILCNKLVDAGILRIIII